MPHDLDRQDVRDETGTVFSGIPVGNGNYKDLSSKYKTDGSRTRYDPASQKWVLMGGSRKSRRSTRNRGRSKKSKRVHHTRRKHTRRHRHSRRR